jgi:hypothetical protein
MSADDDIAGIGAHHPFVGADALTERGGEVK